MFIRSRLEEPTTSSDSFIPNENVTQYILKSLYEAFGPRALFTIENAEEVFQREARMTGEVPLERSVILDYFNYMAKTHLLRIVTPDQCFRLSRLDTTSDSIVDIVKAIKRSASKHETSIQAIADGIELSQRGDKHALQSTRAAVDVLFNLGILKGTRTSQNREAYMRWDEDQERRIEMMPVYLEKCHELMKEIEDIEAMTEEVNLGTSKLSRKLQVDPVAENSLWSDFDE